MRLRLLLLIVCWSAVPASAQDFALRQLDSSPRHHEWVVIPSGDRSVHAFVAYPEKAENALAVVVIHENRGLSDWVRSFADQLAEAGYIAVAPDLLSDFDAGHERTSDYADSDAARDAIYQLAPDQVTADLLAVRKYALEIPSANGKVAVAGFCWGGSQTFRFATHAPELAASFVFYGTPPDEGMADIDAPVYGFYGGDDQRVNATIPDTEQRMKDLGKTYESVVYDGAGHGFMRAGDDPEGADANRAARNDAWKRLKSLLESVD